MTAANTILEVANSDLTGQAIFRLMPVAPVDPLDPETNIDPENKPDIPGEQGALSIDFVSQFSFGSQKISVKDEIYYAAPQKLAAADNNEFRPNYVQISDRRGDVGIGWSLSVTQSKQFTNEKGHQQLDGAILNLKNQALVSTDVGKKTELINKDDARLMPNVRSILLSADEAAGKGT